MAKAGTSPWDLTALFNAADPKAGIAERHLWVIRCNATDRGPVRKTRPQSEVDADDARAGLLHQRQLLRQGVHEVDVALVVYRPPTLEALVALNRRTRQRTGPDQYGRT